MSVGLASSPEPARAQADTAAPRAVVDSFFRLVADERFREAARLMDAEAFDAHRRQSVEMARKAQRAPTHLAPSFFLEHDPKMPRAVAEYQARAFNDRVRDETPFTHHEFGYLTVDSLASASTEDALVRWLEAHDIRYQMRRAMRGRVRNGCPAPTKADLESADRPIHLTPAHVMGLVLDGDSIAYALHRDPRFDGEAVRRLYPGATDADSSVVPAPPRATPRPWEMLAPSVTALRRVQGRWLVGNTLGVGSVTGYSSFCMRAPTTRTRKAP